MGSAGLILNFRQRQLRKRAKQSSRRAKAWLSRLVESLQIMRLVRSYSMQSFNQARLERQLIEYERQQRRRYHEEGAVRPTSLFYLSAVVLTVLFLAARIYMNQPISIFAVTVMGIALASLYYPIRALLVRSGSNTNAKDISRCSRSS